MSNHYTLTLNLRLKRDLSEIEIKAMDYIFNGNGTPPDQLPTHTLFEQGLPKELFWKSHQAAPTGSSRSEFWRGVGAFGAPGDGKVDYGVNLLLPGCKLEGALNALPLLCWVATLSNSVGYVGAVTCEDDFIGKPLFLLFVSDHRLTLCTLPDPLVLEPAEGISG